MGDGVESPVDGRIVGAIAGALPAEGQSGSYHQQSVRLGVTQSMGATGTCFDNSPSEAFFASLKRELVHRRRFATRAQAVATYPLNRGLVQRPENALLDRLPHPQRKQALRVGLGSDV